MDIVSTPSAQIVVSVPLSMTRDRGAVPVVKLKGKGGALFTVKGRIKAALDTVGIFTVPELQKHWKDKYKEKLNRQTAHRWLHPDSPVEFVEYKFLFQLAELTEQSPVWLALGKDSPVQLRELKPDQEDVLDLYARIEGARRENWIAAGQDALAAQESARKEAKQTEAQAKSRRKMTVK